MAKEDPDVVPECVILKVYVALQHELRLFPTLPPLLLVLLLLLPRDHQTCHPSIPWQRISLPKVFVEKPCGFERD